MGPSYLNDSGKIDPSGSFDYDVTIRKPNMGVQT